jgi:N6-L-threonylcarbamoyladenine synthase
MRAHALVMRLMDASLDFPFCTLLISGGHCQISLVSSPFKFQTLAEAAKGSPGECLDKLAKRLGIQPVDGHYGAAMERMAKRYET